MQPTPHNAASPIRRFAPSPIRGTHRAFTLIEMVVSISILVIVILAVGVIFQAAGRAVGVSQASMEMLSNDRAIQQQLESDVSGIDKTAFLVIRSANYANVATGTTLRCDQISFISRGSFPNRTGTNSGFTDNATVVPAAFVWWGQLALQATGGSNGAPTNSSTLLDASASTYKVPLNQVPTGAAEADFILGRHAALMVPKNASTNNTAPAGTTIASYPASSTLAALDYNNGTAVSAITAEGVTYDITQSRVSAVQGTPSQMMALLVQAVTGSRSSNPRYEADHYCYRYAALHSPYDGVNFVNGYFRMHPIALQGVSSFIVEWTDGLVYAVGDTDPITGNTVTSTDALVGTTKWYGYGNPKFAGNGVDPTGVGTGTTNGDVYCAVFSFDNRAQWPVALRFRYHVVDASGRIPNGRDFTEVIKVPN